MKIPEKPKKSYQPGTGNHPNKLKNKYRKRQDGKIWNEEAGVWMFPDEAKMAGLGTSGRPKGSDISKKWLGDEYEGTMQAITKERKRKKHPYLHKGD